MTVTWSVSVLEKRWLANTSSALIIMNTDLSWLFVKFAFLPVNQKKRGGNKIKWFTWLVKFTVSLLVCIAISQCHDFNNQCNVVLTDGFNDFDTRQKLFKSNKYLQLPIHIIIIIRLFFVFFLPQWSFNREAPTVSWSGPSFCACA